MKSKLRRGAVASTPRYQIRCQNMENSMRHKSRFTFSNQMARNPCRLIWKNKTRCGEGFFSTGQGVPEGYGLAAITR
jgi:hypothetical protein